ncbi:MAG: NAD(P)-binding domain-containing protein [Phycisphaerales bacterium]|nr:NAD(P)-binding domain-containing protein [Phycisphaerales bacterium]
MGTSSPTTSTTNQAEGTAGESQATVLLADSFQPSGIAALEQQGCHVHVDPSLEGDALVDAIREHDPQVLVVRSTRVSDAAIAAGQSLSLIVRAGAGYDTIDTTAASAQGISVANCPGMNALAVAELAWGLILACDRRIPDQTIDLRAGTWKKKEYAKAAGLHGRTLGVIGLGRIGLAVARRGQAFGMKVIAWSRSLTADTADHLGIGWCEELGNLARMADVVSINVAANADTKHLIDASFCDALRPGAIVVNTSRGSVIDQDALRTAIRDKNVRAGLDVFADEPAAGDPAFSDAIVQEPGVYGTHHVGASTAQAQEAIAAEVVRIISTWLDSGEVPNCVNLATRTSASELLSVRHLNKPGVLAHVFDVIGRGGVNVEEMENVIYADAVAACARIQLDRSIGEDDLEAVRSHEHVISVTRSAIKTPDTPGA